MKPEWLRVEIKGCPATEKKLSGLNTVCKEALCPNISECYSKKTATFLLLGSVCTRNCLYCNISDGMPALPDPSEPEKVAKAVQELGLKHVVLTMVTRDDLPDEGASHIMRTIDAIRKISDAAIEILVSDLDKKHADMVLAHHPDVFSHNIEIVRDLFQRLRPKGNYDRSVELLRHVKKKGFFAKSGMMIGFGESMDDIRATIDDLGFIDCLTVGQYLQPSKKHAKVKKYYAPEEFDKIKEHAIKAGIPYVESGPFVRSSYNAGSVYRQLVSGKKGQAGNI